MFLPECLRQNLDNLLFAEVGQNVGVIIDDLRVCFDDRNGIKVREDGA